MYTNVIDRCRSCVQNCKYSVLLRLTVCMSGSPMLFPGSTEPQFFPLRSTQHRSPKIIFSGCMFLYAKCESIRCLLQLFFQYEMYTWPVLVTRSLLCVERSHQVLLKCITKLWDYQSKHFKIIVLFTSQRILIWRKLNLPSSRVTLNKY